MKESLLSAAQQAHASDVAVLQVPVSTTTPASKTTRVDVETLRRRRRSADVVYPTPSTRAPSRTEMASVSQQTLVQRIVAAVEREAEGYQEEECRRPSWHQR